MTRITVYHKPDCVQCEATMRHLEKRGLAFDSVDLLEDPVAMQQVWVAGHRSAPVVAVDGRLAWSGYQPGQIDALAEEATP